MNTKEKPAKQAAGKYENAKGMVLIVEDDVDTLGLFEILISMAGHQIWGTCTSGEDALTLCEKSKSLPDVVLLDYRLPGINGLQVAKQLLDLDGNMEIILCTADTSVRKNAQACGIRRFKKKPVDNFLLVENVSQAMKNKSRRA